MDCLKTHPDTFLQALVAKWMSGLLDLTHDRTPCPNSKIIKNLCSYLCCDVEHTPLIVPDGNSRSHSPEDEPETSTTSKSDKSHSSCSWRTGIISLQKNEKVLLQMS